MYNMWIDCVAGSGLRFKEQVQNQYTNSKWTIYFENKKKLNKWRMRKASDTSFGSSFDLEGLINGYIENCWCTCGNG